MAVTPELLAQTVSIITDYRKGEIADPDAHHVERWLAQFDEGIREKLITELNRVLTTRLLVASKPALRRKIENERLFIAWPIK